MQKMRTILEPMVPGGR